MWPAATTTSGWVWPMNSISSVAPGVSGATVIIRIGASPAHCRNSGMLAGRMVAGSWPPRFCWLR